MMVHVAVEAELHEFLVSTLDGGERLASCHGRYTPGETDPDTYFIAR